MGAIDGVRALVSPPGPPWVVRERSACSCLVAGLGSCVGLSPGCLLPPMIRGRLPSVLQCVFSVVVRGVLAVVLFFPWTFLVSAAAVLPLFPSRMSPGYTHWGFPLYVEDRVFMSLGWGPPTIPS